MTVDATDAGLFEAARARLTGRAYRIVGVLADADDIVQEAWLRWSAAEPSAIDNADAWLDTVVTRLAIDRLRRRKREEERYVGPWLPSPVVQRLDDPADAAELADSMTTAFLIMLERLSPDERAAFLLATCSGSASTRSQRASNAPSSRVASSRVALAASSATPNRREGTRRTRPMGSSDASSPRSPPVTRQRQWHAWRLTLCT